MAADLGPVVVTAPTRDRLLRLLRLLLMLERMLRLLWSIDPGTRIATPEVLYSEPLVPPVEYPSFFLLGGLIGGSPLF